MSKVNISIKNNRIKTNSNEINVYELDNGQFNNIETQIQMYY